MRILLRACVIALALVAGWTLAPKAAGAGVAGSPHDISSITGLGVCQSCHHPHHVPNSPLLWNHVLSTATYKWSDWTATTGGTTLPTNIDTWTGTTRNCLSCHDGTVERGKTYDPAQTKGTVLTGAFVIAPVTAGVGDLKGNHPVAVPFPLGGVKNTYNGISNGANAVLSGWATPTKVKIFNDGTPTATNNGIECASCHNPHDNATAQPFLRLTNAGSAICLDCHVK